MDCPSCDVEMVELQKDGDDHPLRKCGDCGGLWIDVSDLNRVLLHNNSAGLESLGGRVNAEADSGQCRDCLVDLVRVEGGDRNHPVSYDTCESCGGVFLESEFKDASDFKQALQEIVAFFQAFSNSKKKKAI